MIHLTDISVTSRLNHINFELLQDDFTFVIGPNGAGKSSLLQVIAGELAPNQGQCFYQNRNYPNHKELARIRAVLPQHYQLPPYFRVQTLLTELSPPQAKPHLDKIITLFELEHLWHQPCEKLSGGQAQLVMLCKTVLQLIAYQNTGFSQYLLLDEPSSALDLNKSYQVFSKLKQLQTEYHWGILLLSHDLNLCTHFANHIIMLKNNSILKNGLKKDVLNIENLTALFDCPFSQYTNHLKQIIYAPTLSPL